MADIKQSTPRVKATPMQSNPDLMLGVGEKGGISVYGLNRFPLTLYFEQWQTLLDDEVVAELITYAETHKAQLSAGREAAVKADGKPTLISVSSQELAQLDVAIAKATEAMDIPKAVRYATIKSVAALNGNKLPKAEMIEVLQLG